MDVFRIRVDRRGRSAASTGLGYGLGRVATSDVFRLLAAGLDSGDVVDPSVTGTGDNVSGESGFGECVGLRTSGIRLLDRLVTSGRAVVTCVSGSVGTWYVVPPLGGQRVHG